VIEPGPVTPRHNPSAFRHYTPHALILTLAIVGGLLFGFAARSNRPQVYVPPAPFGRTLHLAPIGIFPTEDVESLVTYYERKYGLEVDVLPRIGSPPDAFDYDRYQVVGERLIAELKALPIAADPNAVIIGLTADDMFIEAEDWNYAYGLRDTDRFAVVSDYQMYADSLTNARMARLRKMVTKYVGIQFYGLPESSNPRSVLYNNILGPEDLDAMSEEFILDAQPAR
jgi:hypothetical protein